VIYPFVKKILQTLITLICLSVVCFSLIRFIPGDPVLIMLGERGASPEVYEEMKRALSLDRPIIEQYFIYVQKLLSGDLGTSIVSRQSILSEFLELFPATLELTITSLLFAMMIGVPLGILAANYAHKQQKTWIDSLSSTLSLVGHSMPIFWWALLLILFFSIKLGVTPVSGRIGFLYDVTPYTGLLLIDSLMPENREVFGYSAFLSALSHLILPTLAMGTIPLAMITKITRASMLEILPENFIITAKAKGVAPFRLLFIHALKNALLPIITIIGLMFGTLITGAILTETIFSWPGIGRWFVAAINSRDYPVIQSGLLLIGTLVILLNLFIDSLYPLIDPRTKNESRP
jgi:dipeptide transport system permease protein